MILKQARKMIASNRNLNRLSAELKHSETVEHLILNELPYSLMWKIIDTLHARSNPGEIFRLGLVCKCLRHAIASYDSFWEQRILSLGWSFAHESSSSSSSTAGAAEEPEPSAGRLLGRQRAEAPTGSPFMRFAGRMQLRWQLRGAVKRLVGFMDAPSAMAMAKGASVAELSEAEERLRVPLPAEVWESFRFRNGQLCWPGAEFVDSARLLSLQEMVKEVLGAVKGLEVIGSRVRCADGPYIGGGAEGNELLLPLSTVMRGNRRVACSALTGEVYFQSGLAIIWKSESWLGFLQSLLR
eukprot:CAMPEP_0177626916 /NCGR_PEP_ID=MMETSP0419_2-20121207/30920_1 /TAXON_ID=582737 /ORGANISM="Tetraselmis sp., Strain GSL018" /LENGTH=297 /DNA_ID=CAMNT_0019128025 /DNA_START=173 /DNA_END=1066 /DNA_ORIENTATION=+